jgi:hypothetical protein
MATWNLTRQGIDVCLLDAGDKFGTDHLRAILPEPGGSVPVDFGRAFSTVAGFLEGEGFPVAVVGAFGLHAFGVTRATQDLDLVTDAAARLKTVAFLESLGYETLYVSEGYSNHLHGDPKRGRIDMIYVSGETRRQLFEESKELLTLGGRLARVPCPEHLIAMKVQAIKNDPTRSFQDLADVRSLLMAAQVDRGKVEEHFRRAGLKDKWDELRKSL